MPAPLDAAESPDTGAQQAVPADAAEGGATALDATSDAPPFDATVDGDASSESDASRLGPNDDPCPDSSLPPLWSDCSGQCASPEGGAQTHQCTTGGLYDLLCPTGKALQFNTTALPNVDLTIRTPNHVVSACQQDCSSDATPGITAAIVLLLANSGSTIEVSPPWHISYVQFIYGPADNMVCGPVLYTFGPCADTMHSYWVVWTDSPDPPARNIVIRTNRSCPE